ncbi:hypothetical protein B0J13DRAFT_540806 [Dactylonectria estremocensis]|uniref:Uncharacterized protein n=1 Tax=Dactylonectria estremocensis TaxID=1079267 RepID=A0A9P9FE91_9HYPO|nr:hypothetical protein B0J13DRAFT_540806 [Dactylonectria estremocensis]
MSLPTYLTYLTYLPKVWLTLPLATLTPVLDAARRLAQSGWPKGHGSRRNPLAVLHWPPSGFNWLLKVRLHVRLPVGPKPVEATKGGRPRVPLRLSPDGTHPRH